MSLQHPLVVKLTNPSHHRIIRTHVVEFAACMHTQSATKGTNDLAVAVEARFGHSLSPCMHVPAELLHNMPVCAWHLQRIIINGLQNEIHICSVN